MSHIIAFIVITATPQYTIEPDRRQHLASQVLPAIERSTHFSHNNQPDYLCMYNNSIIDVDSRDIEKIVDVNHASSVWERAKIHMNLR